MNILGFVRKYGDLLNIKIFKMAMTTFSQTWGQSECGSVWDYSTCLFMKQPASSLPQSNSSIHLTLLITHKPFTEPYLKFFLFKTCHIPPSSLANTFVIYAEG